MKKFICLSSFIFMLSITSILFAGSKLEAKDETSFLIITPQDKEIVYDESVNLIGLVSADNAVKKISINGQLAKVVNKRFSINIPLDIGKNIVSIEIEESNGAVTTQNRRVLRKLKFPDIKNFYWAKTAIEDLATIGILTKYHDGTFKPEKSVERAELAATLVKIDNPELPKITADLYSDVKTHYWGAPFVKIAMDKGYFTDYPDGTFKPVQFVTHAEAIAILLRFAGIPEAKEVKKAPFPEVPSHHWAAKAVLKAKEEGIIAENAAFKPNVELSRAALAFMISKLPIIAKKVDDLYDWDKYFETVKKKLY